MLLRASSEPLCAALFAPRAAASPHGARRGGSKFRGVVLAFAADLDDLLRLVTASHTHFVRCVKPNGEKAAHLWDADMVLRQLRCGGVLEAVRVYSSGYPDRMPIKDFVGRFRSVVPRDRAPPPPPAEAQVTNADRELLAKGHATRHEREACEVLLRALGIERGRAALGHSKLFMRAGVAAELQAAREARMLQCAARCQAG